MESSSEDEGRAQTTKKRKSYGRMDDVMKKLRLSLHEISEEWQCKRLKCFENIREGSCKYIIQYFNSLKTYDAQNAYLFGLMTVSPVRTRRPRVDEDEVF
ncbi:hypothetical protein ABEB36_003729 [Hypothenemus hampei]|uniref:Uncharacterized protein n=1 Tax=Hypothenemus hampei TaxID=57062 RepID=A0ABD1F1B4_HYPHA